MVDQLPPSLVPISVNPDKTIGLFDCPNPPDHFIGKFKASLLKEWAEKIIVEFGADTEMYLSVHPNRMPGPMVTAKALGAADEYCGTVQVLLAGLTCEDVEELPKERKWN